jgi:hypothetical protein
MAKIGRNEPCLCGSGLKYKKCCIKKYSSLSYPVSTHSSVDNFQKKVESEHKNSIFRNLDFIPEEEKLSHRIIEIANLISDHYKIPVDKKMIDIVLLAWNFAVVKSVDDEKEISKGIRKILPKNMRKDGEEIFVFLEEVKNRLYPEDFRFVTSHEILESNEELRLNVASTFLKEPDENKVIEKTNRKAKFMHKFLGLS